VTITLDNLTKARPLAEQLELVRQACNDMNRAPAVLTVYVDKNIGVRSRQVDIPNSVALRLLREEEIRLVAELANLGVQA
jgi:hypothetical protein